MFPDRAIDLIFTSTISLANNLFRAIHGTDRVEGMVFWRPEEGLRPKLQRIFEPIADFVITGMLVTLIKCFDSALTESLGSASTNRLDSRFSPTWMRKRWNQKPAAAAIPSAAAAEAVRRDGGDSMMISFGLWR